MVYFSIILVDYFSIILYNNKPIKDPVALYGQWNYNNSPNVEVNPPSLLVELTERKLQFPNELNLLVNIGNSIKACRDVILVFKDAKHIDDLPTPFLRIPYVLNESELTLWRKTRHNTKFSLFNKNRFKRTGLTQQGKPVFHEIDTNYYWYLDNFHKNEYEVFDENRTHIGVANMDGEIDYNKVEKGRNF